MKRSNRQRYRPEEVVAKLRQPDEAVAKGTPIAEAARPRGVSEVTLPTRERERRLAERRPCPHLPRQLASWERRGSRSSRSPDTAGCAPFARNVAVCCGRTPPDGLDTGAGEAQRVIA